MALSRAVKRKENLASSDSKRDLIIAAARRVFESEGLEGASLRGIAKEAGYTPAALYFHFDSKEALYAEILTESLEALAKKVNAAFRSETDLENRLRRAAMAFYYFYAANPRDLDLGFYLFKGGMSPVGLGKERDNKLNDQLWEALAPINQAFLDLGQDEDQAKALTAGTFAHTSGMLLLEHTGRMRLFDTTGELLMHSYLDNQLKLIADKS